MRLGAVDGSVPVCSVSGTIVPAAQVTRLRLLAMFGKYLTDVPVGPKGYFAFRNLECGDYMIIVMAADKCLGTKATRAQVSPRRLELKIGPPNRATCTTLRE